MTPELLSERLHGLMTREQSFISLEVQGIILTVEVSVGFVTNIINIKTFIAIGALSDGVTSIFLCLAVSDFMMCFSAIADSCSIIFTAIEAKWRPNLDQSTSEFFLPVDPRFLGIVTVYAMRIFTVITIALTICLSVARCLCVVQPLEFRKSINVKKTLVFVTMVSILSLACRLPLLAYDRIVMVFDVRFNSSRPTLRLLPGRKTLRDVTSCLGSQVTLVVCIGIMLKGLKAAAEFRSKASTTTCTVGDSARSEVKNPD